MDNSENNEMIENTENDDMIVVTGKKEGSGRGLFLFLGMIIGAAFAALIMMAAGRGKSTQGLGDIITDETAQKLIKIRQKISSYYLFDQDVDTQTGLIKGYVDSYGDPYTVYYTDEEYQSLMESTSGVYCGIGVVVQQNASTGVITIVRPYVNAPGWEAGMRAEDILYKVAGEEVTGVDLNLVVTKIKGDEGTTVDVTVYRPSTNEYIDMTLTRRKVEIETIAYEMLDDGIGYIEMSSFDEVTYHQFMDAFNDLKDQNMKSLIVDIRDNGGGLLTSVCDILDALLPEGIITYTEDRDGKGDQYYSDKACMLDVPMVVLVNGNSASASEIFTGALQDYGKATIVGTQTFGKGIVQTIMALGDGSAVKVTVSRYFTPKGVCIHGVGITPDEVVENDLEKEGDEQLEAAKAILLKQMN